MSSFCLSCFLQISQISKQNISWRFRSSYVWSTYGVIAIVGEVEVIAAVAILPAIINSFLFLSSVKRIVEHREIKNPTLHADDFKLKSTDENHAPITLVRLLVAKKPLSEKQICNEILKLAAFSGVLAIITAFMMGANIL